MRYRYIVLLSVLLLHAVNGCGRRSDNSGPRYSPAPLADHVPRYIYAVHPLHNPTELVQTYHPLVDYLNARLKDAQLTLEASRDYATFEDKYRNRKPEFLLPNPWQTLDAIESGYHVLAMAGEPTDFKGLIIVRKDGGIAHPSDLIGKAVSYPAPTALAACIMPQNFLFHHGINVNRDLDNRYVGSQESSIMNVYLKLTAAGATWPPPWRAFQRDHPKEAEGLMVMWQTESLVNNAFMARNDVPQPLKDQILSILTGLSESPEGQEILSGIETSRFLAANDADYDTVRTYILRFERDVRKVDQR
jgi:phosphonate transport system substrate-binding protein